MADYYVHPNAICETTSVGAGTRIWAFAHILLEAKIGRDCNICDQVAEIAWQSAGLAVTWRDRLERVLDRSLKRQFATRFLLR